MSTKIAKLASSQDLHSYERLNSMKLTTHSPPLKPSRKKWLGQNTLEHMTKILCKIILYREKKKYANDSNGTSTNSQFFISLKI
jgi:hypothetical protein